MDYYRSVACVLPRMFGIFVRFGVSISVQINNHRHAEFGSHADVKEKFVNLIIHTIVGNIVLLLQYYSMAKV